MRIRRLALAMLVALALGPTWAVGPMARPPVSAADTLPACRYADIPTAFTSPDDWQRTLVDTIFMVDHTYVPPDLVPVSRAGIGGGGEIRQIVIPDLAAMTKAAAAAGTPIAVESAYRSYATQIATFSYWKRNYGEQAALLGSARPGHSEHQLGLAIDFRSADAPAQWSGDWATTPAGAWMAANAWRYGFIMSYPAATSPSVTCYRYEPWHYRYVGRDEAAAIHALGTTTRQYLWYQAGNDAVLAGTASPTPAVTAATTPAPTATPTATPATRHTTSPSPTATASLEPVAPATSVAMARASTRPESGVAGATGRSGSGPPGSPIGLVLEALGIMLGIILGIGILVAAEQLSRALRRWGHGLRLA